jgi:hypothetical protein
MMEAINFRVEQHPDGYTLMIFKDGDENPIIYNQKTLYEIMFLLGQESSLKIR